MTGPLAAGGGACIAKENEEKVICIRKREKSRVTLAWRTIYF
jgi:hypothetical protein